MHGGTVNKAIQAESLPLRNSQERESSKKGATRAGS